MDLFQLNQGIAEQYFDRPESVKHIINFDKLARHYWFMLLQSQYEDQATVKKAYAEFRCFAQQIEAEDPQAFRVFHLLKKSYDDLFLAFSALGKLKLVDRPEFL